jgi:hypothetical protein
MDVTIPCPCPKVNGRLRHESDKVTLRNKLDFRQATTITKSVQFIDNDDEQSRAAEVLATLSEYYILVGIERWTIRDAANKPVPVTKNAIRQTILDRPAVYAPIEVAADKLYQEVILLPLVEAASSSSQPSPTEPPMSPRLDGEQPKRPKRSKQSSISTIPTAATVTTSSSPDGDSNSSQSSVTAA